MGGVSRLRRLINRRTLVIFISALAGLSVVAFIVLILVLQRNVNMAMARALIGGLAECDTHGKATGLDSQGLPKGPVSSGFVAARADANLVYPSAAVLQRSTGPEVFCGPGMARHAAEARIEFSTPDPVDAVNRWYATHLGAEGWRECAEDLRMPTSGGETIRGFHRGHRESYTVDHFVPVYPSPPPGNLFTVTYGIDPYVDPTIPPPWNGICTLVTPSA